MFCEPVNSLLTLLVVGKGGELLSEYDLFSRYKLGRFVRSAGSAIVDRRNNLIVLDYARGEIWAVMDEKGRKSMRRLGDVGAQQVTNLFFFSVHRVMAG